MIQNFTRCDIYRTEQKTPFDEYAEKEDGFMVDLALCTLEPREREAMVLRHHEELTFEAIGRVWGVGKERARQVCCRAERKLRQPKRIFIFEGCCGIGRN